MIIAARKEIKQAHRMDANQTTAWVILTWSGLPYGKGVLTHTSNGGGILWLGLALLYFVLYR